MVSGSFCSSYRGALSQFQRWPWFWVLCLWPWGGIPHHQWCIFSFWLILFSFGFTSAGEVPQTLGCKNKAKSDVEWGKCWAGGGTACYQALFSHHISGLSLPQVNLTKNNYFNNNRINTPQYICKCSSFSIFEFLIRQIFFKGEHMKWKIPRNTVFI